MDSNESEATPDYRAQNAKWFIRTIVLFVVVMLMMVGVRLTKSDSVPFELTYEGSDLMKTIGWWLVGLAMLMGAIGAFKGLKAWRHDQGLSKLFWLSLLSVPGVPIGLALWAAALFGLPSMGHGRVLRLRGRTQTPGLRRGSDYSGAAMPDTSGLDDATKAALESLWLDDARAEHASVPAFARLSWILSAVGAPAKLLEGTHRAALQEIDHTRKCFALAAGYGDRSHTADAMPQLLRLGIDAGADPWQQLAFESLIDGCLNEGYNALIAEHGAAHCSDRSAHGVLKMIAAQEAQHAELAWDVVSWMLTQDEPATSTALLRARTQLEAGLPHPAPSPQSTGLCTLADRQALKAHGRLDTAASRALWATALDETRMRLDGLLDQSGAASSAAA